MTRLLTVGLLAAVALLTVSGLTVSGASAKPVSDDCTLGAHVFAYWGGADAEAQGRVECGSRKQWIRVSAVVTRDGAFVASGGHRCMKDTRCRITPDGDQRWCVEVSGEVSGGSALAPRTFCEEFDTV